MNGQHTVDTRYDGQKSPAEIEDEISHTRAELSATLDALGRKLSPGELVDQALHYLRGPSEFASNLGESFKRNPMPVALVGVGLAWLMTSGRSGSMGVSGSMPEMPAGAMGERLEQAAGRLSETAQNVRGKLQSGVERAREQAGWLGGTVREQGQRAKSAVQTMWSDEPLVLGALGVALGAVLGAGIPITRKESETLRPKRDELLQKAAETGKEKLQQAGMTGERSVQQTPSSAATPSTGSESLIKPERPAGGDVSADVSVRPGGGGGGGRRKDIPGLE